MRLLAMTGEEGVCPLWATFLTRDFYTRLAPIGWAPEALPPVAAMSVSGTQESGFSKVSALLTKILRKMFYKKKVPQINYGTLVTL